ncbi:MAG: AtpZ/AtpI family protein [Acidobacteriaceae bacterium]|nr:AtpZ/AtpI family protein [Acidobacteriaceae bacterium]
MTLNYQYIEAAPLTPSAWCNEGEMVDESNKKPSRKNSGLKDYVRAEQLVMLALAIPSGCVVGLLIGSWLDSHFHQHWIGLVGIILGAVGGFVQIFTVAARYMKDKR